MHRRLGGRDRRRGDPPGRRPQVVLVGTGSEVSLCVDAAEQLAAAGIRANVVSMPSWDRFAAQTPAIRTTCCPPGCPCCRSRPRSRSGGSATPTNRSASIVSAPARRECRDGEVGYQRRQRRGSRHPPGSGKGVIMDRLAHLYHEFGQSPWLDNLKRGYITSGQLAPSGRQGHSWPDQQPDHLPEGHPRLCRLRRAVPQAGRGQRSDHRRLLGDGARRHQRRARRLRRRCTTTVTAPTASSASRSPRTSPTTLRAPRPRPATCTRQIHRPNLMVKIPATAEGVPADPGDDRRRPQHQRHVDLQPRSLPGGDRGLHRRFGGVRQAARRRPVEGGQRGQLLHQPGRHRGRSSPRGHRLTRGAGTARQGCRRPGQARLPDVPEDVQRPSVGGAWPPRAPSCSDRCGPARRPRTRRIPTRCTSTS